MQPGAISAFERHYGLKELAKTWSLSVETIRKIVAVEPGVIRVRLGKKKAHTRYSVPESVAQRIHTRLLNGG